MTLHPITNPARLVLAGLVFFMLALCLLSLPAAAQGLPTGTPYGLQDIERRLTEMEQEGAQRNGSTERMQFAITAIAKRVDEIQKDYDLRLNDLEKKILALEGRGLSVPTLPATAVSGSVAAVGVSIPATISATDMYNKAYAYLTATQYPLAEAWLLEFTKRHPKDKLADNAFYWLGETRMVQNNPAGAVQAFRDGLRAFPQGVKAPDNWFKMGVALEQLKKPAEAKMAWQLVVKNYPASTQAGRAKSRLAGLKE